jgi:hypothetical protein
LAIREFGGELSFVLKMSTPKRKRSLLDFRKKREIVEIKNTTNNESKITLEWQK